jgi:hypothetical protein
MSVRVSVCYKATCTVNPNFFIVAQDYEIKYHEIFSTLNNKSNKIFTV